MARSKSNLFFLYGDEEFLIEEHHRAIVNQASTAETLSDDEATPQKILEATQSLSLFGGGSKCITVKNPSFLESSTESKGKSKESRADSEVDDSSAWWDQVPVETTVIFWIDGNPDRRRKVVKELMAACDVREGKGFSSWEADQVAQWISRRMEKVKQPIEPDAIDLLIATTGTALRPLVQELEKLSLYAGPGEPITVAQVERLARPGAVAAFALSNALRERDLTASIALLERMFEEREEPVRIIGQLAAQFRMIAQVKSLSDSRMDVGRMSSQLGSNPGYVRRCLDSARLFTFLELKAILYKMHEIDLQLKTTMISPRALLEELMYVICRGVPAGEPVLASR